MSSNSFKWSAIERIGTQAVQLVTMLILAKQLGPSAFGLIGMLTIFIAISQSFVDCGFSNALIRKLDRDERDYSTTFIFSIGVAVVCYCVIYLFASKIAAFYGENELENLVKVLALPVVINAFSTIQRVKLTVALDFKTQAKASLLSVFLSSAIAIYLAFNGQGVWTLVVQAVLFSLVNTFLLNIYSPWLPRQGFSKESFDELFGFGSKMLVSGLIDTVYNNIYQVIIGKYFNSSQLGYFTQGRNLSSIPAQTLTVIIQRVTFPSLSKIQNDNEKLEFEYKKNLKIASSIIFPIVIGIGLISDPLIELLLGKEWESSAKIVTILCFGFMLYPIHAINLNYLQVKGRSDLFLKVEVIKKIIASIILLVTIPFGVIAICIGISAHSYIALFINLATVGNISSLKVISQLKQIIPIWLVVFVSASIAYLVGNQVESALVKIVVELSLSLVFYILTLKIFCNDIYVFFKSMIFNN